MYHMKIGVHSHRMFPDLVPADTSERPPPPARHAATPALFSPSERAERRFWEFFTAHIRNPNTRLAYLAAIRRFAGWCELRGLALNQVEPMVVAAYVEQLTAARSPATVKQHLAALRMLFDWLVVGQVLPFNPASSVRGPRHVVKSGKTPVLSAKETRDLLDGIDVSTLVGLPDRAFLDVLVYSFARVSAAVYIRSDNGPEFVADTVRQWVAAVGVRTAFIEPGSPWETGYIESFNARLRDELLNGEIFYTLKEAQVLIESWRRHYNAVRPHSSLGYRPPGLAERPSMH